MTKCKHMTPIKAQYDQMTPTATISDTKKVRILTPQTTTIIPKETNNTSNT